MIARDFFTPIVLLALALLVHGARASNPEPCSENDKCDYPKEFCKACPPQRSTRSAETIDQTIIVKNYMPKYVQAFRCADADFNNVTAANMANETVPRYLSGIKEADIREVSRRLQELQQYINKVQNTTISNYDKTTLCDMSSRIQSTLNTLHARACESHIVYNDCTNRIKEEFKMTDNSVTQVNRQRQVIYTVFEKLYERLSLLSRNTSASVSNVSASCNPPENCHSLQEQIIVVLRSIPVYEKAFQCTDRTFDKKTAIDAITPKITNGYMESLQYLSNKNVTAYLKELETYIKEAMNKYPTDNNKHTLNDMRLQITATLQWFPNDTTFKRSLLMTDSQHSQHKVIYAIFHQLYKRLREVYGKPVKCVGDTKKTLQNLRSLKNKIKELKKKSGGRRDLHKRHSLWTNLAKLIQNYRNLLKEIEESDKRIVPERTNFKQSVGRFVKVFDSITRNDKKEKNAQKAKKNKSCRVDFCVTYQNLNKTLDKLLKKVAKKKFKSMNKIGV